MSWPRGCRDIVYERQRGMCEWCGNPLDKKEMVLHHRINKSRGGADSESNARGRHPVCEGEAHQRTKDGNYDSFRQPQDRQARRQHRDSSLQRCLQSSHLPERKDEGDDSPVPRGRGDVRQRRHKRRHQVNEARLWRSRMS